MNQTRLVLLLSPNPESFYQFSNTKLKVLRYKIANGSITFNNLIALAITCTKTITCRISILNCETV